MIPSTQFSGDGENISLQLEVDEVVESVDDDSSSDSCHDPASEEEDDIKQEPESMDWMPQNGDSTYQKRGNLFPMSTSEWTDLGGDHLSQATLVVKQEPTDTDEYGNSVTQSVETTQSKTVYHCTQLTSSGATSHPIMSDILQSVMSTNNITSVKPSGIQEISLTETQSVLNPLGSGPQSVFSNIPGVSVAQTPCPAVQNPAVIGPPTLLPVTPGLTQTIKLATSGNVVQPQVLNVIKRGNSLILGSASSSPSTVTPNLQNPLFMFAHPVGTDVQSDSNLPPNIPVAANVSNVDQGGSVTLQPMLEPVSGVEWSSRGQQVYTSSESPSVLDPVTTAVKQETPSISDPQPTNTPTDSYNRGAEDKQTDEGCKQMDEKIFIQSKKLQTHMRTQGEEPYKCDVCGKEFNWIENLHKHMRTHIEKPYRCDVCGKVFNYIGHLKTHIRKHTGDKPYKCDVCEKAFSQLGNLQAHIRTHTGEKPYKCDVCWKAFSETGSLQRHKRIHTGDKPYKCDVCGNAFNQKGALQIHTRAHTGDKPYKCDVCGKAFSETGSLQKHKRIHTGDRPYKCDVCAKTFSQAGNLQKHRRTHTGNKPHKCDVCGKAFSETGNLQRHKRIHTGDKPNKCGAFIDVMFVGGHSNS